MNALLPRIFLRFAGLSLLAVGGAGAVLPEAHRQLVEGEHWFTSSQFAEIFAIAQTAPGPNVIVFPLFGWELAGFAGFCAAALGVLGPSSLLALALARKLRENADSPGLKRLKRALIPLAVGLMAANGAILARAADTNALAAVITFAAAGFVVYSARSPVWAMAAGALLAVAAERLGFL
ncbi:chromate transporter [Rhodoblastus acidophilus]|uniref:Chromate transporter n=1 Tax=Rhodoblastus acidophilus TaxID=1074 RepID=A0A212QJH6_RHOAC|nr:chromate transporter [Rhodoblastus acidophilus]SNB59504.1 chromate transporter [Rhodoblastus acidophilus]